jgi:hypothetical protein
MTITPSLFEAYLECPTKCWLKSINESSTGNAYAEWVETQSESYLADGMHRLRSGALVPGCTIVPEIKNLKGDKWLLAVDVPPKTHEFNSTEVRSRSEGTRLVTSIPRVNVVSRLHAVERIPEKGPGNVATRLEVLAV